MHSCNYCFFFINMYYLIINVILVNIYYNEYINYNEIINICIYKLLTAKII